MAVVQLRALARVPVLDRLVVLKLQLDLPDIHGHALLSMSVRVDGLVRNQEGCVFLLQVKQLLLVQLVDILRRVVSHCLALDIQLQFVWAACVNQVLPAKLHDLLFQLIVCILTR